MSPLLQHYPKRNIETWIYFIRKKEADETTAYPKLDRERDCKQDVDELLDHVCGHGLPENAPQSLRLAYTELQRIL